MNTGRAIPIKETDTGKLLVVILNILTLDYVSALIESSELEVHELNITAYTS
jgi:hypothetical protein